MKKKKPHYIVEQFKGATQLQRRCNEHFQREDDPHYLYLLTEGPSGYTAIFAESRKPKPKE